MTIKKLLALTFILSYLSSFSQISFGDSQKINDNWKFILQDTPEAKNSSYKDTNWQTVDVPHDWSIEGTYSEDNGTDWQTGFLPAGIGWYRKTLNWDAT